MTCRLIHGGSERGWWVWYVCVYDLFVGSELGLVRK